MNTLYIAIKIVIFLLVVGNIYDLLYLDICKRKTKYFTVGGLGATNVKIESDLIRRGLKIILLIILFFLLFNFPPLLVIFDFTQSNR